MVNILRMDEEEDVDAGYVMTQKTNEDFYD